MRKEDLGLGHIGQISRRVQDIDASVEWYKNVLGLPHLLTFGKLAFFDCGGTRLYLQADSEEVEGMKEGESVLYFQVENIHITFEDLKARGVHFRAEPHLIHRHEGGLEEWMAFFDDPEGRVLALMCQIRPSQAQETSNSGGRPRGVRSTHRSTADSTKRCQAGANLPYGAALSISTARAGAPSEPGMSSGRQTSL
jgi:catechol 2,3-dioxygenase-like lactoylglutathione lyase family enzyme